MTHRDTQAMTQGNIHEPCELDKDDYEGAS